MRSGLCLAIVAMFLALTACGGGDDEGNGEPAPSQEAAFDEGTIRMEIELLDTGLLKGHAYVDANEGWRVDGVDMVALTDDGTEWGVIEIQEQGESDFEVFFEVQIQELPRGDQVTVSATATFAGEAGAVSKRTVSDKWPP